MRKRNSLPDGTWTEERIVLALREYTKRHGIPSAANFNTGAMKRGEKEELLNRFYADDYVYPHLGTIISRFKTWNNAMRAAGLRPLKTGNRRTDSTPQFDDGEVEG